MSELAPVVRTELPDGLTAWVITRYSEGKQTLADGRLVKDLRALDSGDRERIPRFAEDVWSVCGRHMLNSDGADHARLRSVVVPYLSPTAISQVEPVVESLAEALLESMKVGRAAELMSGYAQPLTESVLAHVLGISDPLMRQAATLTRELGGRENPETARMRSAYSDLLDFTRDLILQLRGKDPAQTIVSALAQGVDKGEITLREMSSTILMLMGAGISSTAIAIGHNAAVLMQSRDLIAALSKDRIRAASLIDELLRLHPPFAFSPWRYAREPLEIAGATIPAGAIVFVLLAAANRDPTVYNGTESQVSDRSKHLTFGFGTHYCVGASLARMEISTALRTLFAELPDIRLRVPYDEVRWHGLLFDRAPTAIPVYTGALEH
ncbi:cytochrome P450 [Nocardia brasiliensis]|uniref:cytochrome P450 n=1 Tax=Nocardia brasiliensis TaxID=37326 RepID=UPI0024586E31|nr:cytochrome P450 [Nocardia brasiliensis]